MYSKPTARCQLLQLRSTKTYKVACRNFPTSNMSKVRFPCFVLSGFRLPKCTNASTKHHSLSPQKP